MKWHLDAWAPTEGLAFASQRLGNVDPWSDAERFVATMSIAAPGFDAQPVDRSIAFGAVRCGFQERFSLNGNSEYGFESLRQLIDFVRRIYLGSGPGSSPSGDIQVTPPVLDAPDNQPFDTELGTLLKLKSTVDRNWHIAKLLHSADIRRRAAYILVGWADESDAAKQRMLSRHCLWTALRLDPAAAYDSIAHLSNTRPKPHFDEFIRYSHYYDFRFHEWMWPSQRLGRLRIIDVARIPNSAVLFSGAAIPRKVQTVFDLASYLGADRELVAQLPTSQLLSAMLALAALVCQQALGLADDEMLLQCARFIVSSLPIESLPHDLESAIHEWCERDPNLQRNPLR